MNHWYNQSDSNESFHGDDRIGTMYTLVAISTKACFEPGEEDFTDALSGICQRRTRSPPHTMLELKTNLSLRQSVKRASRARTSSKHETYRRNLPT